MGPYKEAPQQHTQPSRKGKKAWRKNVDVTEIQAGLEEARQELIEGLVPSFIETYGSRATPNMNIAVSLRKSILSLSLP